MEDKKTKLIEYLEKNLAVAEEKVRGIEILDSTIEDKKRELEALVAERGGLGSKEKAAADVEEIKGYIDMFNEPEEIEEPEVVADECVAVPEEAPVTNVFVAY